MAWVKLDDMVVEHRKHLKAGPAACWLWVCGIAYCQRQLSDGFIPDEAIPLLGVLRGAKGLVTRLVAAGLFEQVEGGYHVHHYLDHNHSREQAMAHRAELAAARSKAGRIGGLRSADGRAEATGKQTGKQTASNGLKQNEAPSHPIPSPPNQKEHASACDPFTDPTITERAGLFIERYAALYQQHRGGARYVVNPTRDYAAAVPLCQTWSDERLDKLAIMFFKTDNSFAENGSRTIAQFKALASWCDGRLAEYEAKHGVIGA